MVRSTGVRGVLPPAVALSLSVMVLLSARAPLPVMRPSDLPSLEAGTPIWVEGVVTAIDHYESGWTALTVTDLGDGASAKVLCAPAGPAPPVGGPSIGDLIAASGETAHGDAMPLLFSTWDSVEVLATASLVLDVGTLCENWNHFLGDRFEVSGILRPGPLLSDPSGKSSIPLAAGSLPLQALYGLAVVVDSTLSMDYTSMALVLGAWSVQPVPA